MTDNPISMYVLCELGFSLRSIHKLAEEGFTLDDFKNNTEKAQILNISKPSTVQKIIELLPLITKEDVDNSLYKLASEGLSERNIKVLQDCGLTYYDIATLTKEKLSELTGAVKNALYEKVKIAFENVEIKLGSTPITHIISSIESLLNRLKPREVITLPEIFENIRAEYPDAHEAFIEDFLQKKIEKGLIFQSEYGYSKKYKSISEYLSEDFKSKDILLARMDGMTLQEIADYYGLSRERIRQKERAAIKKMPELEELIVYKEVFEKYDWEEDIFQIVFNEPKEVFQMLNLIYDKGQNQILDHLDMFPLSKSQNSKILRYYESFIDYEGKVQQLNNKMAFFENILYYYGKNLVNDYEIVNKINDYLNEYQQDSKYLTEENSVRGLADRSRKVIRDKSNAFRFYDYKQIDETVLKDLMELVNLPHGIYSMTKIFNENLELMQEIDIRSEYELHNLYKRLIEVEDVVYTRMPEFSIGNSDKNSFLIRLFHEQAPILIDEFTKFVEENYGLKQNSLRSHIQMFLPEYIHGEEIRVDYILLEETELEKLRELLVEDIYTVEQLDRIGSVVDPDFHDKFLNNMTLMKLGYSLKGNYVLTSAYGSVERYFNDLILNQDYFVREPKDIFKTTTFNMALYFLEKDLDIVKVEKDTYITAKKLNEAGVSKEDLIDFRNEVIRLAPKGKFFTLHTIQKAGLMHSLEELGFDSIFYERIIWTAPNIRTIPLAIGYIFLISNKDVSLKDFIQSIVEEFESINLYDLQDYIKDNYKINLDIYKITSIIRDSHMYYSEDMNKIYIDKNTFYEEIY